MTWAYWIIYWRREKRILLLHKHHIKKNKAFSSHLILVGWFVPTVICIHCRFLLKDEKEKLSGAKREFASYFDMKIFFFFKLMFYMLVRTYWMCARIVYWKSNKSTCWLRETKLYALDVSHLFYANQNLYRQKVKNVI